MITLARLNHEPLIVNAVHIVTVESTPDTMVTLSTGEKLLVRESAAEVAGKVTQYLRSVGIGPTLAVRRVSAADMDDGAT